MGYSSLAQCVKDLAQCGQLRIIDAEVDPYLEIAAIQRRVFRSAGPALLFTKVKNTRFPMLANLFGTKARVEYLFRDTLDVTKNFFALLGGQKKEYKKLLTALPHLVHVLTRNVTAKYAPILARRCFKNDLPCLVSWPQDGGAFITLPLVYTEDPDKPGVNKSNLGMYRVQITGNDYAQDEVGLHYQIHRGIGVHHAHALAQGVPLPVNIHVGGPPALTLAAVMPLPEGVSELRLAGLLGGRSISLAHLPGFALPVLADADFCISGHIAPCTKPEGPFGDHLGYYSLQHPFPVLQIQRISHRRNAIWPFTTVGRPPQEDTIFGDFIHELTAPLISKIFSGVAEVHAVDACGVHPLLLALGQERYIPWEARRKPRELLTQALHLLGTSQTSLAKYLFITAKEDAPGLSCRDLPAFLKHLLERTDFSTDLHFLTASTTDTLDYTGRALNEGSKMIWASAGEKRRELATEILGLPSLPEGFGEARVAGAGLLVLKGPVHTLERNRQDPNMENLAAVLATWQNREGFPLIAVADDPNFCSAKLENFIWVTFTRSDPATDSYGAEACLHSKHWSCQAPFILDARCKPFHAPVLEEDPAVSKRVEDLAKQGGPLFGCF